MGQADIDISQSAAQSNPVSVREGDVPEREGGAPATPHFQEPLRNTPADDEPEPSGRWDPEPYRPGDFAEADAMDSGVDHCPLTTQTRTWMLMSPRNKCWTR